MDAAGGLLAAAGKGGHAAVFGIQLALVSSACLATTA